MSSTCFQIIWLNYFLNEAWIGTDQSTWSKELYLNYYVQAFRFKKLLQLQPDWLRKQGSPNSPDK